MPERQPPAPPEPGETEAVGDSGPPRRDGGSGRARLDHLSGLLRSPLSLDRLVGMREPPGPGGGRTPRPTTRRWRVWVAVLAALAIAGTLAFEFVPRAFGQPSMQSWIRQTLVSGTINAFAGQQIKEQVAAERLVQSMTTDQFIIANANRLSEIQAGDTFIPGWRLPHGVDPLQFIRTPKGRAYQKMALSVLRFEVEDLGLLQIRLGIRWADTIGPDGNFSLAFYKPYLDFLTSYRAPSTGRRVRLLLGVGPLKSPGWPESFIPGVRRRGASTALIPTGGLPGTNARITASMSGSDLVSKARKWLNTLMWQVSTDYPSINYFQLDNEPRNHAGPRGWVMGSGYEAGLASIVLAYRPQASFLINWSGTADLTASFNFNIQPSLGEAVKLADIFTRHSVIQEMLALRRALLGAVGRAGGGGQVVLGLDSYHLTPDIPQVPVKVKVGGRTYQIRLDTTALIEVAEQLAGDYSPWELLHSQKIPMEVTEMQAEPWGRFRSPGNDPKEFLFEIERALTVLPPGQTSTLRFWRLSNVVYDLIYDHKRFADAANPMEMRGTHGKFAANNKVELEIAAAVSGVSKVERVNGRLVLNNTRIDRAISHYLSQVPSSSAGGTR